MSRARADARTIARDVLVRVETTEAFADVLLAHRLDESGLAPLDRRLASELVFGTLVWQGRLDHHLRALLHDPLERLDPPVRAALRLGLFQVLFLDRVPAYAAVDASVRLAGRRASGLVNAVLRRAVRTGRDGLGLPDSARDPIGRLAVEWSHPRWLVERWVRELGADAAARLLEADTRPPRTAIRTNLRRTTRDALRTLLDDAGVPTEPGLGSTALVVQSGGRRLRGLPAYADGLFSFQGDASQLVVDLLDVAADARVLDACAGVGGKTLAAVERLGPVGRVLALDPNPSGLARLGREAARLGVGGIAVAVADARRPPVRGAFDAVLIDAPCSGLGTLRRHPELKWRRKPEDVARLAALQREIVRGVAPLVRPGGTLVYAVCTVTTEETSDVVTALLAADPRFVVERRPVPGVDGDGFLRTAPHAHDVDGFFAARLRART